MTNFDLDFIGEAISERLFGNDFVSRTHLATADERNEVEKKDEFLKLLGVHVGPDYRLTDAELMKIGQFIADTVEAYKKQVEEHQGHELVMPRKVTGMVKIPSPVPKLARG